MSNDNEPLPFVDADPGFKTDADVKGTDKPACDKEEPSYPVPLSMLTRDQMGWLLVNKTPAVQDQFPPVFGMNAHGVDGDEVAAMLLNGRKKFAPSDPNEWLAQQANRWFHECLKFMKANGELGLGFMEHLDKADQNAKAIYELHLDLESQKQMVDLLRAKMAGALNASGETLRQAAAGERQDAATLAELRAALDNAKRELAKLQSFSDWQTGTIREYMKHSGELSLRLSGAVGHTVRPATLRAELDCLIDLYVILKETWPSQFGLAVAQQERDRIAAAKKAEEEVPTAEMVD
jgi:hypothetical protein